MLHLQQLTIGYGKTPLVRSITASAQQGELSILAGRNGTGKSTLIRTIAGLLVPISGRVEINQRSIDTMSPRERAAAISLVLSQSRAETALRVREVIALGAWPRTLEAHHHDVEALLEQFNLAHLAERRLDQISDGERQKTMIARAMLQATPLIVMDEPTAFLDLPSRIEWWRDLRTLKAAGKTVIVSTHDLHQAHELAETDRWWVLRNDASFTEYPSDLSLDALIECLG